MCRMGVVFGAYLALMPIVVAIAGVAFDHWAREKWMRTLGMIADLAAHSGMLFLLWPVRNPTTPPPTHTHHRRAD